MSIETLMKNACCEVWPARWRGLFRILKAHYMFGKAIYDTVGYFFI
jgi:hypothetical protein